MNTAVTIREPRRQEMSFLLDPVKFDHLQRVRAMLANSSLFPEHLRKGGEKQAIANAVLVLDMANRLNEHILAVAQNIYFVSGKPGWNTSYMISKANQHGVFRDPINWDIAGKGDDLSVTAFAILRNTGSRVQVTCDMNMAKAEGWTKNPKYKTMPEQMLRYRSAAFLIRLYCPEVMVGVPMQVENELATMRDVSPEGAPEIAPNQEPPVEAAAEAVEDAVEAEDEPEPARRRRTSSRGRSAKASKPAFPSAEQMDGVVELIIADLQHAGVEHVGATYADHIAMMKVHYPEKHARVMSVLREASASKEAVKEPAADDNDLFGAAAPADDFFSTPLARQFLADVDEVGLNEAIELHEPQLDHLRASSSEAWRALIRRAEDLGASH